MPSPLMVCASCARHVRLVEPSCPFCGAARGEASARPTHFPSAWGRPALLAFGAALSASLAGGCGDGGEADAGRDSAVADAGGRTDAGGGGTDAGGSDGGGSDGGGSDGGGSDAGGLADAGGSDAGFDAGEIFPPYGTPPIPGDLV
ncbi:MAG: hypothetical protein AB7S26_01815 [Sandaracinaceae bacterium]